MSILESLKRINAYPIPQDFIEMSAVSCGLDMSQAATREALCSAEYMRTRARILYWLAEAPNISQGGQTYSFSEEQRKRFRSDAALLEAEAGVDEKKTSYGYKGERL